MINYYDILNVSFHADEDEIKSSFRRLAKLYHPDTSIFPDTNRMSIIIQAYKILSDKALREKYDSQYLSKDQNSNSNEPFQAKIDQLIIPKKRIIYTSTVKNFVELVETIKNKKNNPNINTKKYDAIIQLLPEEQRKGAIAKISLPIRALCNVCFGDDRFCSRCHGVGRVLTVDDLIIKIPPNASNNQIINIDLTRIKPRKMSNFTLKSFSIKIMMVDKN